MSLRTSFCATCAAFLLISESSRGDEVIEWNNAWLAAIRATGGPPCPISRAGAMLHVAIYDAVNSIERTHEPYVMFENVPATASKEAAVALAGHRMLSMLYGSNSSLQAMFDQLRDAQLSAIPDGPDKIAGMNLGTTCANGIMSIRANDNSDLKVPYPLGGFPGDWQPTPPDYTYPPASPHWPLVTPWTLVRPDQFRPIGPCGFTSMWALLASPCYAAQFQDVKAYGALNSTVRTAEQTLIARFWANDRDGTYKPPGHLNDIAQVVAANNGNTMSQNARLFALLNLALADAGIVAWDAKYSTDIDFWRPITGIRHASVDGNPLTIQDRTWEPLSNDPQVNGFTPPFPAYTSGHATFGAAHAAVLEKFYRTDTMNYTISSDDTPGVFRAYTSFSQAALENGRSRIYLGVHWQFDADDGFQTGQELGHFVVANYLRRIGDTNGDCHVNIDDLFNVIGAWGPCPPPSLSTCPADVHPVGGNGNVNVDDLFAVLAAWGPCP
jgi:hypothetical protein